MKKHKEPTHTFRVLEMLRERDDFMSYQMLAEATGGSYAQVTAACHHLRNRHAIDVIISPDGKGWWYALPPEQDNRTKVLKERTPESKPRRPRKSKYLPI